MYNFINEIANTKDRFLKYYIFQDYFHDSIITNISIIDSNKTLKIELSCEREWSCDSIEENLRNKNHMYNLYFKDCPYIEFSKDSQCLYTEYINGRFKKSAKLEHIREKSNKNYYHLRIQLSHGFIDLIFHKFNVEKQEGTITLPNKIGMYYYFKEIERKFKNINIAEIRNIAKKGDFPKRGNALIYLWLIKDDFTFNLANDAITDNDSNTEAVYILGEIGDFDSIKLLLKSLNNYGDDNMVNMFNKHVNDAIGKILYRFSKVKI